MRRSWKIIFLLLILCVALPGCAAEKTPPLQTEWTVTEGLTLSLLQEAYPPGTEAIPVRMENRSEQRMIYFKEQSLEKYESGRWVPLRSLSWGATGDTLEEHSLGWIRIWGPNGEPFAETGIYRVTGSNLYLRKHISREQETQHPKYEFVFEIREGTPEVKLPEEEGHIFGKLPKIEDWEWYTERDVWNYVDDTQHRLYGTRSAENGIMACFCKKGSSELYRLILFDRKTGQLEVVFDEPVAYKDAYITSGDGFVVRTEDGVYFTTIRNGEVILEKR